MPNTKAFQGGERVTRTAGIKPAVLADPGAQDILICADHQGKDGTHGARLSRFQCCSNSVRSTRAVLVAAALRARITMSQPPRSMCCWRKLSRMIRLIRFRATAWEAALRETASPKRGCCNPLGITRTVKARLVVRAAFAKTRRYSAGRVRRSARTKLAGPRSKTRKLDAQASASFGPARLDDRAAVLGRHARAEPMGARTMQIAGLVGSFHNRYDSFI